MAQAITLTRQGNSNAVVIGVAQLISVDANGTGSAVYVAGQSAIMVTETPAQVATLANA